MHEQENIVDECSTVLVIEVGVDTRKMKTSKIVLKFQTDNLGKQHYLVLFTEMKYQAKFLHIIKGRDVHTHL
jgi:hypothetical protein